MIPAPRLNADASGLPSPDDRFENAWPQTMLDGGVSSDIRIVHAPNGRYVIKRALDKLRVTADWCSDPARSSTEVRALRAMAKIIGPQHVPHVLGVDEASHRFAMQWIDERFENWKRQLLQDRIDLATAKSVGRLLAQLHARSVRDTALAREFASLQPFTELRIRPFFERVAERNSALAPAIRDIVATMLANRSALVHGDFSPKNLLVDGADVVVVDCEVTHWGDPRFDVSFCLAHFLLKAFRRRASTSRLMHCALAFLAEYRRSGPAILDTNFVRQLGCLMLARLDGDSPVDYLDDLDIEGVRQFASALIVHPTEFDGLIA